MSECFDPAALLAAPLVASLECHEQLGSTNDRAKACADEAPALPHLVVAEQQTAGRGRGANRWWSSDGALTFSLLLALGEKGATGEQGATGELGIAPEQQGALSITTALALCDAIAETAKSDAIIKWPNDVLIEGKKVAGILLETPRPDRLVIGVGLNVRNVFSSAPSEIRHRAASLQEFTKAELSIQEALLASLHHLASRIDQLAARDPRLPIAWNDRSWLTNRRITLELANGQTQTGLCTGLAEDGALLLEGGRRFTSGVVTQIDPPA